jgi:hypothetical protein
MGNKPAQTLAFPDFPRECCRSAPTEQQRVIEEYPRGQRLPNGDNSFTCLCRQDNAALQGGAWLATEQGPTSTFFIFEETACSREPRSVPD